MAIPPFVNLMFHIIRLFFAFVNSFFEKINIYAKHFAIFFKTEFCDKQAQMRNGGVLRLIIAHLAPRIGYMHIL